MKRPLQARKSQLDELGELTREQARLVALDAASLTVAAVSGWCLFAEALHPAHPSAALLAFSAARSSVDREYRSGDVADSAIHLDRIVRRVHVVDGEEAAGLDLDHPGITEVPTAAVVA